MNRLNLPKRAWILVAFIALVISALACGPSTPEPTATPIPPTPTPTPIPPTATPIPPTPEPKQPQAEGGSLDIVNDSGETICFVYISTSDSEDWGPEQLGEDTILEPGQTFTITDIPPGTYDIKAEDCSGEIMARNYEVKLGAADFTWTIGGAATATLILENRSGVSLCYLYITTDSSSGWGPDQLGEGNIINNGENFTITDIPPGVYDLRVESCEGQFAERQDVSIETEFTWTIE